MNRSQVFHTILVILIFTACQPESNPISYGVDKCDFCRMTIVDQRFGGEIVSQKGKVYKFDAVECMVHYIDEHVDDESKLNLILTNTYDQPGTLTDAKDCYYLKSKNMPSPMGMFLNPFRNHEKARQLQLKNSGEILNWMKLRADLKK
jgi:copper chaperone NosL